MNETITNNKGMEVEVLQAALEAEFSFAHPNYKIYSHGQRECDRLFYWN
ncbi:hypothetical protein A0J48_023975 [Sphaerospermopsis aphanizomenoides BCCUSP55]|nr:hypothetical protein [Sphaerospermopsis aphanizomenoides]MBK1990544.1 hypothetical protein [Sphaerospermopsis aphanizomenoides BCCUSP55]